MYSAMRLPINSEYVLQAVSKPKLTSTISFFRSPSMVLGQPMTLVVQPFFKKYSANKHALVLLSSPPITTSPSSFNDSQFSKLDSNSY